MTEDLERGPNCLTQDVSGELSNSTTQSASRKLFSTEAFHLDPESKLFISRESLKLDSIKIFSMRDTKEIIC